MLHKYLAFVLLFLLLLLLAIIDASELFVHVDNVVARFSDQYICSEAFQVTEPDIYVREFIPKLDDKVVHHLLLFALKFV